MKKIESEPAAGTVKTFFDDFLMIFKFFMMIQWVAQDYDSLNWFIILRVSSDTSDFVRDLQLIFFTILGFIYTQQNVINNDDPQFIHPRN